MEKVMEVYNLVMAHKMDIINLVSYAIAGATIIVKLTPTPKDDVLLAKVIKFISKFVALNK